MEQTLPRAQLERQLPARVRCCKCPTARMEEGQEHTVLPLRNRVSIDPARPAVPRELLQELQDKAGTR